MLFIRRLSYIKMYKAATSASNTATGVAREISVISNV